MDTLRIKAAETLVTSGKNPVILRNVLLSLENQNGHVFGLVQVTGTPSEAKEALAETVIEHVQHLKEVADGQKNVPRKFEQILQKMNVKLFALHEANPRIGLSDFHGVIGIQIDNQIYLSGIGKLHAVFLHKTAKQRYVVYELDKQLNEGQKWEKPFITVLDGEFHAGDIFYLATRINVREISLAELKDNLVTLPASGALERIGQYLHRDSSYGAVAIKANSAASKKKPKKVNPLSSVQQLTTTKESTAQLLNDQTPEIGTAVKKFVQPIVDKLSAPGTSGPGALLKRFTKITVQVVTAGIVSVLTFGKNTLHSLQQMQKSRAKTPKLTVKESSSPKSEKKPSSDEPIAARLKSSVNTSFQKMKSMPRKRQYISAGIATVVLLFTIAVGVSSLNKSKDEDAQIAETVILRIEEKKNAAEASLIYQDTEQAKTLVTEAIALLDELPTDENYKAEIDRLTGELNSILSDIRGINEVPTTSLGSIPNGSLQSVSLVNGVIYAFNDTNQLYQFNELNRSWEQVTTTNGSISTITSSYTEDTNILVLDQNNTLGRTDLTSATINPISSGAPGMASIEGLDLYNGNVYALTAIDEQIVRMRPQGLNFDAGTPWINSRNTSLLDATGIAVDGDIYVLLKSQVVKFASGREEAFSLASVEPALSEAIDIHTEIESDDLYVLEPAQNRVLVFSKETGELVIQYSSPNLATAKSMHVAEDKNTIFVQTENEVISFPARHLLN